MIYCVCLNIDEDKIKDLKSQGLSWEEIKTKLGLGESCGICLEDVCNKGKKC